MAGNNYKFVTYLLALSLFFTPSAWGLAPVSTFQETPDDLAAEFAKRMLQERLRPMTPRVPVPRTPQDSKPRATIRRGLSSDSKEALKPSGQPRLEVRGNTALALDVALAPPKVAPKPGISTKAKKRLGRVTSLPRTRAFSTALGTLFETYAKYLGKSERAKKPMILTSFAAGLSEVSGKKVEEIELLSDEALLQVIARALREKKEIFQNFQNLIKAIQKIEEGIKAEKARLSENRRKEEKARKKKRARRALDSLFGKTNFSAGGMIRALIDAFPEPGSGSLKELYKGDTGTEAGSVARHTVSVLNQFKQQAGFYNLDQVAVPAGVRISRLLKATLALHDIGKSKSDAFKDVQLQEKVEDYRQKLEEKGFTESDLKIVDAAVSKEEVSASGRLMGFLDLQHEFTLPILEEKLTALGLGEAEIKIAKSLVNNELLGDFAKEYLTFDGEEIPPAEAFAEAQLVYEALGKQAELAGMAVKDFYTLQKLFYVSDATSYEEVRERYFSRLGDEADSQLDHPSWKFLDHLIQFPPERAAVILPHVQDVSGQSMDLDANPEFYDVAEKINRKFLPNHGIGNSATAKIVFQDGSLRSLKNLREVEKEKASGGNQVEVGPSESEETEGDQDKFGFPDDLGRKAMGTYDDVFISAKGPFMEFLGSEDEPLIVFKGDLLENKDSKYNIRFSPFDSGAHYRYREDLEKLSFRTKKEVDAYYNAFLRNSGMLRKIWKIKRDNELESSLYPEAQLKGELPITSENTEVILLTDKDYTDFIKDDGISNEIKSLFVNIKEIYGTDNTIDAYYQFTNLDKDLDTPLADLAKTKGKDQETTQIRREIPEVADKIIAYFQAREGQFGELGTLDLLRGIRRGFRKKSFNPEWRTWFQQNIFETLSEELNLNGDLMTDAFIGEVFSLATQKMKANLAAETVTQYFQTEFDVENPSLEKIQNWLRAALNRQADQNWREWRNKMVSDLKTRFIEKGLLPSGAEGLDERVREYINSYQEGLLKMQEVLGSSKSLANWFGFFRAALRRFGPEQTTQAKDQDIETFLTQSSAGESTLASLWKSLSPKQKTGVLYKNLLRRERQILQDAFIKFLGQLNRLRNLKGDQKRFQRETQTLLRELNRFHQLLGTYIEADMFALEQYVSWLAGTKKFSYIELRKVLPGAYEALAMLFRNRQDFKMKDKAKFGQGHIPLTAFGKAIHSPSQTLARTTPHQVAA